MALIRNQLFDILAEAVKPLFPSDEQDGSLESLIELDIPKQTQHGDYATNLALALSRRLKRNPREIAKQIEQQIKDPKGLIERVEIAGPGFMNFFIRPGAWTEVIAEIFQQSEAYGRQDLGKGKKVQVEFVSANPTGPLHIGHGRGAATGDVLARIFAACGYDVEREYYINDAGKQMDTLGRSLYYRYQELLGERIEFPEDHYRGEYMREVAREFQKEAGERYHNAPLDDVLPVFTKYAGDHILAGIREDLEVFGVGFDIWFSERTLHAQDAIRKTLEALEASGHVYESEGAKWFRSTQFGDEKDRVVVRANGISTYFAADLAYHKNKFDRGYDLVVDIWGADHHGYVPRMLAGVEALGRKRSDLQVILVQLVNLLRAGKPVAMSTRSGEFVTLREVIDEVGADAARYIFLTRRTDSHLDFDLDVAKMQSNDNPVYYVQYAHARLCSIFEVAKERGVSVDLSVAVPPELELLQLPEERHLIKMLGELPWVVASSAQFLEPHRIPYYLHDLVSLFHSYYNRNRILGEEAELTRARLYLAHALRTVLQNALRLIGVKAPEKM
ncbi:MAG: arginine--tRNA ligase [Syntrophobacteraceae bacterium]